ncbi:MAG: hypothetical protein NTZ59_09885 [Bacteroidetes bacterium]|nr:hypothetical protein [Bacteroidota bacterium]
MKLFTYILIILFATACLQEKITPADNALDAARGYKTACLKGNFDIAKNYLTESSKSSYYFTEHQKDFKILSDAQKRELYAASLVIYTVKSISPTQSLVIVKDSYTKLIDTITTIKQNNIWLVQLK